MEGYKFTYMDKTYELGLDKCTDFLNDEEKPVEGIAEEDILSLLKQGEEVSFDVEYYDEPCQSCLSEAQGKRKYYKLLEYHFYIYTLKGKYIVSTISKEYVDTSFNKLLRQGKVDNSYIVSIIVCMDCGGYTIEINQCEV